MNSQKALDHLKPACTRILRTSDRSLCGTGYLAGPDLVATCHHVVARYLDEPLVCRFGDMDIVEIPARVLRWDADLDTAILRLAEPARAKPVLHDGAVAELKEWMGYGFPAFAVPLGIPIDGRILDANTVDKDGRPALCLLVHEFLGEVPETVGGFSGSPVLCDGMLAGQVNRVLGAQAAWQKPHLGIVFATPVPAVEALLADEGTGDRTGRCAPVRRGHVRRFNADTAGTSEVRMARYARMAGLVEGLRSAASPRAVLQGLDEWRDAGLPADEGTLLAAETLIALADAEAAIALLGTAGDAPRAVELRALALSVAGDHAAARVLLADLPGGEETAGILGGLLKRRWQEEGTRSLLNAAYFSYRDRNAIEPTPYLAVNTAALALLRGFRDECAAEAARARDLVLAVPESRRTHWEWASLAEADLLLGAIPQARTAYEHAVAGATDRIRDVAVMRRQARLDLAAMGLDRHAMDDVLVVGGIACIVSPLSDPTEWSAARIAAAHAAVERIVGERGIRYGFGSAAPGDLLLAGVLARARASFQAFLPCAPDDFEGRSVPDAFRERFQGLPPDAVSVVAEGPPGQPFLACDAAARRAAADFSRRLDERPVLIALVPSRGRSDVRVTAAVDQWRGQPWPRDLAGDVVEVPPD